MLVELPTKQGRTFRGIIEDFLASFKELHKSLLPAYETTEGKAAYDLTLASLQENFPQYVRELQGTADGAHVPFHHLMLLHMDQIVPMNSGQERSSGTNGCSSVCVNHDGQVLLGHTEDALPDTLNHVYLVSAHITEEEPQGKWGTRSEGFTALCYAGHLPGFCMGYNHHGLVFSINIISPQKVLAGKTPRHFLCRALLSSKTMEKAQQILRDRGTGSADGFSVNMSFTRQEGDHLFHNAEVGPVQDTEESELSILTLSPGEHLLHTNNSNHRHTRAHDCCPPETRTALLALLSDTHDTTFPFFREGGDPDFVKTVALGVFDLVEKTWTIWMKNPRTADPLLTLPLLFTWSD
ncbi:putative Acyl-coenzyme A:6-aminopenicillanic acid acyl-transferase-containing protein 2 [Homarus americanus]|uniref:Putative Acyl-coenzyme A:6-aminopenicillanic acid acyl-transferase-containing protein 2 n=1 Tax=Homarus americanus TaxID=6706 RepID=A0A8J5NC25_HOMAM|nr:putative Acyl-coenzyme A:6-aminopenicillanic acid acyl-transferase-containing protein 2 [Homarus americanus]